jgi:putative ABC transport system permease protein
MALLIAVFGAVLGTGVGAWLGRGITQMYTRFFHFPVFAYRLDAWVAIIAVGISGGASLLGTFAAVIRSVRLPPAQAMRPEPPATYRPTILERVGFQQQLTPASRMILRQLERRPVRAALTSLGIAMAVAVLVLGSYMKDAIEYAIDLQFEKSQRQDMTVTFIEPVSGSAIHEIDHLPGVSRSEPFRALSVRIRHQHLSRRVALTGLTASRSLFRLIDLRGDAVALPKDGLLLSAKLAELLEVSVGDNVTVEVLEQSRPTRAVAVSALIEDFAGTSAYMELGALHRLMREQDAISGAYVAADANQFDRLYRRLKETPQVAGVTLTQAMLENFRQTIAENLMRFRTFNVAFACIIAFGVVYNSVRIGLAERSRELATLRVIGFTRAETSALLLGELAVLTIVAIPAGLLLGYSFAAVTSMAYNTELFRIPLVVERGTFGSAAAVVIIAAVVSGLIVRRRVDRLDLVAVLKTKE